MRRPVDKRQCAEAGGQRVQVLSCSYRARVISLNQGPATSIHSLLSDAWAVAATWPEPCAAWPVRGTTGLWD
jgi:hypothetical protein